jgi:hypothetical protein
MVTCPPGVRPSQRLTFSLPEKKPATDSPAAAAPPNRYLYEVTVPVGYQPGQPLVLIIGDQRLRVACPPNAKPGEKVRFQLPSHLQQKELETISVEYDLNGWIRSLSTDTISFRWVYHSPTATPSDGDAAPAEGSPAASPSSSPSPGSLDLYADAFVRLLVPSTSTDQPLGELDFVHAADYTMACSVPHTSIDSYELAAIASLSYPKKISWLQNHFTSSLRRPWEEGHYQIRVRRSRLLQDSIEAILAIPSTEMNRIFRYEFLGEAGLDAGGLTKEWFHLIALELFHPDFGLFLVSNTNQMCLQINPTAAVSVIHGEVDTERFFLFTGRFLARALLDQQLLPSSHFIASFYKQLMGFPLCFHDMEAIDHTVYRSLLNLLTIEDLQSLALDHTITENILGTQTTTELIPNGAEVPVTRENLLSYLQCQWKYRLFESIKAPLHAILRGFYEVMSEPLLAVLSPQELELLLHGLPTIDLADWKAHTEYTGAFSSASSEGGELPSSSSTRSARRPSVGSSSAPPPAPHEVCEWFWEIVESFSEEYRAKLLQFSTGTSGVPSLGFGSLTGSDGTPKSFCLHGDPTLEIFPRSHTCFNRIDLPLYRSKEDMQKYLTIAITCESVGFGLV